VGFKGEVVADEALQHGQFVAGANKDGWHLRGVQAGRDFEPRFADLRASHDGDTCPVCGGRLQFATAIEVGHIFKLGTRYSAPLDATFVDEDGLEKPLVMGSYGIGPARVMAATVEQRHDENGIIWPKSIAPYDVHVVVVKGAEDVGEQAAAALESAGLDVLLDDRDLRPGEKFADADLIGIPIRITAGKKSLDDGAVDVKDRATGAERRVNVADLGKEVG
jgi:prolyl-tRNA synthetase